MLDNICTNFLENKFNGADLLVRRHKDLKEISVTQVAPLAILLGEITNLCHEKKSEAVFIDHSAYCLGDIIDTLRLRAVCLS